MGREQDAESRDPAERTRRLRTRTPRTLLDDPYVPLDNNATERALRGMVIGRKSLSRSKRGTEVAALFYSLVETARLNDIERRRLPSAPRRSSRPT